MSKEPEEKDDEQQGPKFPAWYFKPVADPADSTVPYESKLVESDDDVKKLGKGWVDHPSKLPKKKAADDTGDAPAPHAPPAKK